MIQRRRHYIYPDSDTLVAAFVCEFQNFLTEASSAERPCHVALSGGSTPLAIFRQLAQITRKEDWANIQLYWGDERMVPPDHKQSNYGEARKLLIEPLGLSPDQVHRIRGEEDPSNEAGRYGQLLVDRLDAENGLPVFDWVWLGLGGDGHTASIFPHQIELWKAEQPCVVAMHPDSGQKRISLSGTVINAAKRVTFLALGKEKSHVINEIVMKEGDYLKYPAFYVNPASGNLEWYLDMEATNWL